MESRRDFIKTVSMAGITLPFMTPGHFGPASKTDADQHQICYFTKHLQWLDMEDLGIVLHEAGFDGADLTVRPGGHVEPENAGSQLPGAVSVLQKHGITIPMVVTSIVDVGDKGIDELLKALADNGVKYYRMGYFDYNYAVSMEDNVKNFHLRLKSLEEKNARYNLCGCYQNHAGNRFGASVWDLQMALRGLDTNYISCQFDVRHAVYEGAKSWVNDMRGINGFVQTTVVKDFYWEKNAKGQWTNHNCQMGEGMVDFDQYFDLFKALKIPGPISNHSEYELISKAEEGLSKNKKMDIAIERLKKDVDFTKKYLKRI